MSEEFRQIFSTPPPAADIFAIYQLTYEFHQERKYRQSFESHCKWYRETARRHQQELQKMRGDINLLRWFY